MKGKRSPVELEQQALQILERVLEQDVEQRAELLETTCGDDPHLHSRVTKLLHHEAHGELLQPAGMPNLSELMPEMCDDAIPGGRIGAYELVRPIARGGMGWVYEAIQDKPKRRVALKILRRGFESDASRRRFRLESEVLAYLKHPGIAQVYEAGVHLEQGVLGADPMPFLALEFVDRARSITHYAREEQLPRAAMIKLFLEACEAVHYGHLRGVIHRDLKPGNILVGADGKVKVIDFGIARVVTAEIDTTLDFTDTGQLLGTLGSMSPEQFGSDPKEVDTRSDVYSLGVLLFQMLTGKRPFDLEGKSVAEAAALVRTGTPIRPRSLVPDLSQELEAVLFKALQSERDQRYGTVLALMEDLRRYLRHEPVLARSPGALQRIRLFASRHPLPVALVIALFLVLSLATAFSLNRVRVAEAAIEAKEIALLEAQAATLAKQDALERAEAAREAESASLAYEQLLKVDLLAFQDTVLLRFTERFEDWGLGLDNRVEVLRMCIATFDDMSPRSRLDSTVQSALGDLHLRLGDLLGNPSMLSLGDTEQARNSYAAAHSIAEGLLLHPVGSAARRYGRYLEALLSMRMGSLSHGSGSLEQALEQFQDAKERFVQLESDFPEDERYVMGLADVLTALGQCAAELQKDPDFVLACYRQAIALVEGLGAAAEEDPACARFLDDSYRQMATLLGHHGQTVEALEILESSLQRSLDQLAQKPDDSGIRLGLANNHLMLADVHQVAEHFALADAQAQASYDLLLELMDEPDTRDSSFLSMVLVVSMRGSIHLGLAEQAQASGEAQRALLDQAKEYLEEALAMIEEGMLGVAADPLLSNMKASATQNLKRVRASLRRF